VILIAAPASTVPTGGYLVNAALCGQPGFCSIVADSLSAVVHHASNPDLDVRAVIADSILLFDTKSDFGELDTTGTRVPVGLIAHSLPSLLPDTSVPRRKEFLMAERELLPRFRFIVSPSLFMDRALERRGVRTESIVRIDLAPIVDGRFNPPDSPLRPDRKAARSRSTDRVPGQAGLRVLSVANWSAFKGIGSLGDALAGIRQLSWTWTIVGNWSTDYGIRLRSKLLQSELAGRVTTIAPIEAAGLGDHYRSADVFALPSLVESYGLAFAEALTFGLPVIGCRVAAIPEVVADAGVLVPAGGKDALRDALERFATDPAVLTELREKARVRAKTLPVWSTTAGLLTQRLAAAL